MSPTHCLTPKDAQGVVDAILLGLAQVHKGHDRALRLIVAALMARGHVLVEDVPGVGKTTLVRALAKVLDLGFQRLQFTADMLPADITGGPTLVTGPGGQNALAFKKGPIFSQLVLADEINRASPKVQSAMLQAMEERKITLDDQTYSLPAPFLVVATQNPVEHHGAYPLPESQLDRFMVALGLGYPDAQDELMLLQEHHGAQTQLNALSPVVQAKQIEAVQAQVASVTMAKDVAAYLLHLGQHSRSHPEVQLGISPRGLLATASLARSWALIHGRNFVTPDDLKAVVPVAFAHRLVMRSPSAGHSQLWVETMLAETAVPR